MLRSFEGPKMRLYFGRGFHGQAAPLGFSFLVPKPPKPLAAVAEIDMSCSASLPVPSNERARAASCKHRLKKQMQ
jgi:hypothetical protein